ncbi:MAG: PCRF domain-containing protein, partial [Oscillospiraceae bacterium]|nr:PCRF domain-containing protein [Oscillospiraceae bacterium]
MFEKLLEVEARYEEISGRLSDAAVVSDNKLYRDLMREYKNLTPVVEKFREYKKAKADLVEAEGILEDAQADRELKEMAQLEYEESRAALETLEEELKILLLPRDENDERNVIVEIRGGAGGEEAALFAS